MARAIAAGELTNLRKDNQFSRLYLGVLQPIQVATAQVDTDPTSDDKLTTVQIKSWSWQNSYTAATKDMLMYIGTTSGAYDKGMVRLRGPLSGTPTSIDVGETSEIDWDTDDHITIVEEFNLHPRHLFIDSDGVVYMDYDIAYSDQHDDPDPVPVLGPLFIPVWLTGADITIDFDASDSWVIGGSITGYSWSFTGAASYNNETTATPDATYDAAGTYRISCEVTADNGKTYTGFRYVRVYTAADPPISQFILEACSGAKDSGGWSSRVTLYDDATLTDIRDRALVCLFARDFYGGTEVSIGPISDRENIIMIGWVDGESIEWDPEQGSVSFDIQGPQYWLQNMMGYPSGLESVSGAPSAWTEMQTLTPRKGFWHWWHWRTTATRILDIQLTSDTTEVSLFNAAPGTLWDQISSEAFAMIFARPVCDRFARIWVEVESNLVPTADRSGWPIVMTITEDDWRRPITIERQTVSRVSLVDLSGVFYEVATGDADPLFSLAPGHIPKWHGGAIERYERLALSSQGQSNTLSGLVLAWRNNVYPSISIPLGQNNRMIDVTPHQYLAITISAGDTERGISGTLYMFPTSVSLTRSEDSGALLCDVTAEGETDETGIPLQNGDIPPDPPDGGEPPPPPDEWEPEPILTPGWPLVVLAATKGDSTESTVGNIYKTSDFSGPEGGDPTWAVKDATGLPATRYIADFNADPTDKENKIYVLLSQTNPTSTSDLELWYSDDGGDSFSKIMDNATANSDLSLTGYIKCFTINETNGDVLVGWSENAISPADHYVGISDDYGSSWSWYLAVENRDNRSNLSLKASGSTIFFGGGFLGPLSTPSWTESLNYGSSWQDPPTTVGSSSWHPTMHYNNNIGDLYLNVDGSSFGTDLGIRTAADSYDVVRDSDNIPPRGRWRMWLALNEADKMWLLDPSDVIHYTADAWTSITSGSAMDIEIGGIGWCGEFDDEEDYKRMILFNDNAGDDDEADEESILVTIDWGATLTNKSGANYATGPGYTNSIPCIDGGIAGIVVVDRDYYH